MIDRICEFCGNTFSVIPSRIKYGRGKHCSRECQYKDAIGKITSPASLYKEGHISYTKGMKHTLESRIKMSKALKGKYCGSLHSTWKGDKVSYFGLHSWIKRTYGKANKCENPSGCVYPRKTPNCKELLSPKKFEWANISGEYHRDRSDWIMLCCSCHHLFDNNNHKF
jgi:hypothetical protein